MAKNFSWCYFLGCFLYFSRLPRAFINFIAVFLHSIFCIFVLNTQEASTLTNTQTPLDGKETRTEVVPGSDGLWSQIQSPPSKSENNQNKKRSEYFMIIMLSFPIL